MALTTFTTELKNIGKQEFLRLNFAYRYFFDIQKAKVYQFPKMIKLKQVLKEVYSKKVKKGELEEEQYLIDLGNIERRFNNLINVEKVNSIGSNKTILQEGDIIIPKMQPQMGNIFLNLEHKKYIGSTELLEYKIKKGFNPIFLYYLFTSKKFLSDLAKLESGKTHRRVNPIDLLKIKIPKISKEIQDRTVAEIEPIEKRIKELKSQIKPPQEIINKVFAREFGFDLEKFEDSKREKFFEVSFNDIAKNYLLRSSAHFHHVKLKLIENKLKSEKFWVSLINKFKLFGGKRIPKGMHFSNDETEFYYLRPTEISIFGVDKSNIPNISKVIYNKLKKYNIKTGEFCISIVGTLGKTALINTQALNIKCNNLILSENFIKLVPKGTINKLFYYYYFYSFIFKTQMEREYTITSIKKLGIDKWNYIKIPDLPLSDQQRIANEIKTELDKQKKMEKEIENLRNQIDKIIEEVIK